MGFLRKFFFVHGWALISTEGFLAEDFLLSTDARVIITKGFLAEASVLAKAPLGGFGG